MPNSLLERSQIILAHRTLFRGYGRIYRLFIIGLIPTMLLPLIVATQNSLWGLAAFAACLIVLVASLSGLLLYAGRWTLLAPAVFGGWRYRLPNTFPQNEIWFSDGLGAPTRHRALQQIEAFPKRLTQNPKNGVYALYREHHVVYLLRLSPDGTLSVRSSQSLRKDV